MNFEIRLAGNAIQSGHINEVTFNNWKAWRVQFDNGKEAVLYNCGNEWMQRNEDTLDAQSLIAIGKYIDGIISKTSIPFNGM